MSVITADKFDEGANSKRIISVAIQPRIFISYARSDGEVPARELRERLEKEHPEISLWQDRVRMQGGVGWWKQIADALDVVQYLVLVMTPAAIYSETCWREWRYARQQGVCVYPVKGAVDGNLDYGAMPGWMRKAHFYDLDLEWEVFVNGLKTPCQSSRVPFMAPDLPSQLVTRQEIHDAIVERLLAEDEEQTPAIALRGPGGVGKTTLAAAVCHDEAVITSFDDGILWVTIGENPNLHQAVTKLYAALTGERPAFVDVEDAAYNLSERLRDRRCLIVVDDVWNPAHLKPFLRGGAPSVRLITTRFFDVASEVTLKNVAEMTGDEAEHMLMRQLDERPEDMKGIGELADRLERWPLLLKLVGSALVSRIKRGDSFNNALAYVNRKLDTRGLTAFDHAHPTARNQALASTLDATLDMVDAQDREKLHALAVFPEDISVPVEVVAVLWNVDVYEAEELVERFENLSLLEFDLKQGQLLLHDLIRQYLAERATDLLQLHARLSEALLMANEALIAYRVRWLPLHLMKSGREVELRALLMSVDWLHQKISMVGPDLAVDDFSWFPHDDELQRLAEALRLSAYVTARDADQLPSQLLARLPKQQETAKSVRAACEQWTKESWLLPLRPLLAAPGSPLVATLAGHVGRVRAVAYGPLSDTVISGGDDGVVRVWDVARGIPISALTGHTDWVRSVAVSANGMKVATASDDHTIRVWDLQAGTCVQVINTQHDWLRVVAISRDGKTLYSADDSERVKAWDSDSGHLAQILEGHSAKINAIMTLADGRIVTVSDDRSTRIWDGKSGKQLQQLSGHTGRVVACTVSADEKAILTVGTDNTIREWPLEGDSEPPSRLVTDNVRWTRDLALTPDGRRIITASEDRELELWDTVTGARSGSFKGHTDWVCAVAVGKSGEYAVSASYDGTLKVWRLSATGIEGISTPRHKGLVRAVACLPDEAGVLSVGDDRCLMRWRATEAERVHSTNGIDIHRIAVSPAAEWFVSAEGDAVARVRLIEDLSVHCVFRNHADRVRAVTVTEDGRTAVSVGDDRCIRAWNTTSAVEEAQVPVGTHIRALAVLPDCEHVVSGAVSGRIKIISLKTGTMFADLDGHSAQVSALRLSQDGKILFSASDDHTVRIWDLAENACRHVLQGHQGRVRDIAVAETFLASVAEDATVRLWDVTTGVLIATFTGESPFLTCSVSNDGSRIVAGDRQGYVHFFEPRIFA